jgi:PMP-22/EMP/MP20/Claudin tight junction
LGRSASKTPPPPCAREEFASSHIYAGLLVCRLVAPRSSGSAPTSLRGANMRLIPICGGILSSVALILLAVGMATDHWIDFELHKSSPLNPTILNNDLRTKILARSGAKARKTLDSTTNIEYNVRHYGLWIGCFIERSNSTASCAYIGSKCFTDVCWIRKSAESRTETCKDSRMTPLTNCTAYQFTRAFICMAIILMVLGTSTQLVSLMTYNRTLAAVSGVVIVAAGVIAMMGFSIFYGEEFAKNGIDAGTLRGPSPTRSTDVPCSPLTPSNSCRSSLRAAQPRRSATV